MRVLVCGSRAWTNISAIRRELVKIPGITVIIEGEANGVDRMAKRVAVDLGIPFLPFPAKWELYGKAAGPIRNTQMLLEGKPDLVLAFHEAFTEQTGTADMMRKARLEGIEVRFFDK